MTIGNKQLKKFYSPHRWMLPYIFAQINNVLKKRSKETSKELRIFYALKREINQQKKHIIFLEESLDQLEQLLTKKSV